MKLRNRRRVLQAALAVAGAALLDWRRVAAQTPGRTLIAGPRPPAAQLASDVAVLTAPRRALVIGNSSYALGALKNPANDARAIAEELRRQGFEVALGLDLKRGEMLAAIAAYADSIARSKAVALFYFAGHGLQLAWRNYLVPVDARVENPEDIKARCVDVNAVIEGIGRAANPMNMVILDACRDNPFGRDAKTEQKGLSQLDAPPGTLLAYATSPGNVASDGDAANGLYTEHLLREMKVPEAKIEDVFKRVRLGVRRRSQGQQIPWESTSLEQDFWFIPPKDVLREAQEEAERVKREQEAERKRQEELARIQREQQAERERREQLARLQREQEAERRRLEEERRSQLERLERQRQEELERAHAEQLAQWERIAASTDIARVEDFLRRYPSGPVAELAQLRLDRLLAAQGEKPIEIVSPPQNPYTAGSFRADTAFKPGDSYGYDLFDRDTREPRGSIRGTVTEVTETEVIFDSGLVLDRLGNVVRLPDGRRFSPRQDQPLEYAVGRKWTTRFTTTNARGGRSESHFNFRITGRERITVPAGTFDCFVIEGEGYAITEFGFRVDLGLKRWMAPERVRRPIASEQYRKVAGRIRPPPVLFKKGKAPGGPSGILNNERLELVSFRQA
jgi:uncharacterized caspase-like protein